MARAIILLAQAYGALGAAIAAWFLLWEIDRRDPMARGSWAFRPLLIPGMVLLWPLVLWRLRAPATPSTTMGRHFRAGHARAWGVLAVLLPILVLGALAIRQNGPTEAPPVRLSAP